jgi:hypothetical protein
LASSKSVQNGLKGVHLVSLHKSAAKSCIIEKNSSFAKGPARTPHGASAHAAAVVAAAARFSRCQ